MTSQNLNDLALSDNGFLFDPVSGNTYTLNPVGTFMLKKLIEGLEKSTIVEKLLEEFDASEQVASNDFDQFLQYLAEIDVLK